MNLKGKRILVTGASSGIGQSIAIECAKKGSIIIVSYRNNLKGAEETLSEIKKYSDGFIVRADLTDENQIKELFIEVSKKVGAIDVLVNNAGQAKAGTFSDSESWKEQFENIFFSAVHVSQKFIEQNLDAEIRKILNISSVYGNLEGGNSEYFGYSTAKAALSSMTVSLAKVNGKVLVNALAPGYTWTKEWEGISDKEKEMYSSKTVINRFINPEEIAQLAVAILENDALTGQVITIDGGLSLQRGI